MNNATKARKLGSIGDVNPIEYGGGIILSLPGDSPWLEYCQGLEGGEGCPLELYRVDLYKDGKEFLSWTDWVDWEKVAKFCGQDVAEYTTVRRLRTALSRALAVFDAAEYYGWANFDSYPLVLFESELEERWSHE